MASDPVLLNAFRAQLASVLSIGNPAAFLGLWVAWKDQVDIDRNDLVDVLKEHGIDPPAE